MSHRLRTGRPGAGAAIALIAALLAGCTESLHTYSKPGHDFSVYKEIAIVSFAPDAKQPDTARGAAELPAFLYAVMSAKGYSVIDVQRSVEQISALAAPDKELTPDTLAAVGKALNVSGVVRGVVKYYGLSEDSDASRPTVTSRPGVDMTSATQRRLGFHGTSTSRVKPTWSSGAGAALKLYKATIRLELFDVPGKTVVWWGEASAEGEKEEMKTYANLIFTALLKRFPVSPVRRK
jgi:hypothetical protein